MVPTRFWCSTSQVSRQTYRSVSGTLSQNTPVLKTFKRYKARTCHQTSSRLFGGSEPPHSNTTLVTFPDPQILQKNRSLRLRWAYEHELLVKKKNKDVQCCASVSDYRISLSEQCDSLFEHVNDRLNSCSKKTFRQRHKSAWSSR